jgi:hypothetical protein
MKMRRMSVVVALALLSGVTAWYVLGPRAVPADPIDARFAPIRIEPESVPEFECTRLGYPCTWAEVPPAVFARSLELSTEVLDRLARAGLEATRGWLTALPGMAEVLDGPDVLYFRLESGRPVWVRSSLAAPGSARVPAVPDAVPARYVVGEDRSGDGRINQRDARRVLILDALTYGHPAMPPGLSSPDSVVGLQVAELFRRAPAYADNVDVRVNEAASVETFARWGEYDVIHVAGTTNETHADKGPQKRFAIATGEWIPLDQAVEHRAAWERQGIELVSCCADTPEPERGIVLAVSIDFFREAYPAGLERALVFFNTSRTLYLPLLEVLGSRGNRTSAFFAWQGDTTLSAGMAAARAVYQLTVGEGLSVKQANQRLGLQFDLAGATPLLTDKGGVLRVVWGVDNLRVREIVTLLGSDGAPLLDDAEPEGLIAGALGDGREDFLSVSARIDGMAGGGSEILPGGIPFHHAGSSTLGPDALHTQIWLELDGRPITDPRGIFQEPRDGDVVTVRFDRVPLRQDLRADRTYELEAVVELPRENDEAGESRYSVILGRGYYLDVQYTGQVNGSYAAAAHPPAVLRVFTSDKTPAGQCAIALEISSDSGDHGILGGLLPQPLRPGSYLVVDSRPQANATVQPDSVGLQVRPACALIEPECAGGWRWANSIGGRFQLDRLTATTAAGSFAIDVEGGGIPRRYVVSGRFNVPVRTLAGGRLPPSHACRPR